MLKSPDQEKKKLLQRPASLEIAHYKKGAVWSGFDRSQQLWFAKMISDAKSLRISDIHIDVRAWEGKACNIVIRSFCGQRRFSVGTDVAVQHNPVLKLNSCTDDTWSSGLVGCSRWGIQLHVSLVNGTRTPAR